MFCPCFPHNVIPAGTKWRAGTSGDFAAQDPGSASPSGMTAFEGSFSIWTHFGGNPVSPKWIMKDGRDIWVVKCAASLRRKRSVFEENGHLTTQMSQKQFCLRFGGPEGSPKPLLDKKQSKGPGNKSCACKREDKRNFCCALRSPERCHPRRGVSEERGPQ